MRSVHLWCARLLACAAAILFLAAPAGASASHDSDPRFVEAYPSGTGWSGYHGSRKSRRFSHSVGAHGLVAPLAAKVAEITSACGASLISGVRHTFVAGTRRISLHASGRAADLAGNPSCIYARLQGWPGGYSTDYGRVRHVHVSYDPDGRREWGARFVHGGKHRHGRHHRKYRRR